MKVEINLIVLYCCIVANFVVVFRAVLLFIFSSNERQHKHNEVGPNGTTVSGEDIRPSSVATPVTRGRSASVTRGRFHPLLHASVTKSSRAKCVSIKIFRAPLAGRSCTDFPTASHIYIRADTRNKHRWSWYEVR